MHRSACHQNLSALLPYTSHNRGTVIQKAANLHSIAVCISKAIMIMKEDFSKRNVLCHPCVARSLPKDTAHSQRFQVVVFYYIHPFLSLYTPM